MHFSSKYSVTSTFPDLLPHFTVSKVLFLFSITWQSFGKLQPNLCVGSAGERLVRYYNNIRIIFLLTLVFLLSVIAKEE